MINYLNKLRSYYRKQVSAIVPKYNRVWKDNATITDNRPTNCTSRNIAEHWPPHGTKTQYKWSIHISIHQQDYFKNRKDTEDIITKQGHKIKQMPHTVGETTNNESRTTTTESQI